MPQTDAPTLTPREATKQRKLFQQKKARMATSWLSWLEFEKELSGNPAYSQAIHKAVARISQEVALEKNVNGRVIRWDEGRDRVLTIDYLQSMEKRFGKSFATVHRDVGRIASHASWLSGIYRRGDGSILGDVTRELRECSGAPKLEFAPPAQPVLVLNAAGINEHIREKNASFQKAQKEFLGDEPPKAGTQEFGFLRDVDRQARFRDKASKKRKPRKNWRKEI